MKDTKKDNFKIMESTENCFICGYDGHLYEAQGGKIMCPQCQTIQPFSDCCQGSEIDCKPDKKEDKSEE